MDGELTYKLESRVIREMINFDRRSRMGTYAQLNQIEQEKEISRLKKRIVALENFRNIISDEMGKENARLKAELSNLEKYDPLNRPPIVCLCGSTRFMSAFHAVGWEFTLQGYIVLSVGVCKSSEHHGAEALGQDVADRLDELHLRKIDLADIVYVLNVDGYIGDSTRREIEYATKMGNL